ncbi:MAG TPA: ABC transporter permease [Blastocatellia bacterium]|nr:ABC transporter permease [Blastocatellia bacterium]
MIETLLQDIRYGTRLLLKKPGFTVIAVMAVALGIGANTATFSVVNGVLLRPLAFADPDRIVTVLHTGSRPVSPPNFRDWREQSGSFEQMAAAEAWGPILTSRDTPEQIRGLSMGEGLFQLLGVQPLHGRYFQGDDYGSGNDRVVVLSHGLWQRRFGADPNILGQTLTLDGHAYTVIGVMPSGFQFPPFWASKTEIWAPLSLAERAGNRRASSLRVFARLKPGVTREQAQAEMDAISGRLAQAYPDANAGLTAKVEPLHEKVVGDLRPALLVLMGAVGFVLLITCANVANLLLARSAVRQKEIVIRSALGASRSRVVRQLMTESLILSMLGGALGLLLAFLGIDLLKALLQGSSNDFSVRMPRLHEVGLDLSTLGFGFLLSQLTGLIFGLAPALQLSGANLNEALKEGGRSVTEGGRARRLRDALVVSEVAIAFVLLVGAGLMMRSFLTLRAIDSGFRSDNVLTFTVSLAGAKDRVGPAREAFYKDLIGRLESSPGVQSVSAVNHLPLAGDVWGTDLAIEGRPVPAPGEQINSTFRVCRPGYFATMGIPLIAGRDFTDRDTNDAPGAVVINETLARTHWPGEDPLGKRITLADPRRDPKWLTVVGVVKDVKQREWAAEPKNELYLPFQQVRSYFEGTAPFSSYMTLIVRTSTDPLALSDAARDAVWSIDRNLPVSSMASLDQVVSDAVWQERFNLLLIGAFAALAMILAAVGIYGVLSFSVTQRTQEIGIRMAMGAQRSDVLRLVIGQGMTLTLIGVAVGLAGAFALTRWLSSLLYGVSATDPLTFAGISLLFGAVALLASYIPARKAMNVDPMVALRRG